MKFQVGPWTYTVKITRGALRCAGVDEECAGLFVWRDREILISGKLPVTSRVDVLIHELRHAWREHFGAGLNIEDECNNVASFCVSVWRQLLEQGGEAALEAMAPPLKSDKFHGLNRQVEAMADRIRSMDMRPGPTKKQIDTCGRLLGEDARSVAEVALCCAVSKWAIYKRRRRLEQRLGVALPRMHKAGRPPIPPAGPPAMGREQVATMLRTIMKKEPKQQRRSNGSRNT